MRSSAAGWLKGRTSVFATVSSGIPGDSTVATGASTGPASPGLYWTLIITVSWMPWYPPSNLAIFFRPV